MTNNLDSSTLPKNCYEFFNLWKRQLRNDGKTLPDGTPANNGDRTPSDLANYERALKDTVFGEVGSEDLHAAPLSLLALEEKRILDTMIRGTTRRKGQAPSKHLESSLRSWMRRMLTDMAFCLGHKSLRPLPGRKLWKPYRTTLPPFPLERWPNGLIQEYAQLEANCANRFYAGTGHDQLKRHRVKPSTWANYKRCINRVVEYGMTAEGLSEMTLLDVVDYDRILRVRAWYFGRKSRGGYASFKILCMAVAAIARYLEITGELNSGFDPFSKLPSAPWMKFFELAAETEKEGHSLGMVDKLPDLPPLPPKEMEALARELSIGLPRRANGRPAPHQIHGRRQAATFYGMAAGAPVRIKNWTEMRWEHNLKQDADGFWHVHFRPEELKNGTRGKVPREYRIKLPVSKGKWVDWWREHLRDVVGPDFETKCPYVFPGRGRRLDANGDIVWKKGREDRFYRLVRDSCLEVRGHAYRPHAIRSDVTEYALGKKDANMRSVLQVAMLLGDTERTVLKSYNKPDVQAMLDEDYFADIAADD